MLNITAIPALQDNYIWALHNDQHVVIVDPGEVAPVLEYLQQTGLQLHAILNTHRHGDHVGGIQELRRVYNVPVYGRSHPQNPYITDDLIEGDQLRLEPPGISFDIMETPGHYEGHIVFSAPGSLFCGDMIFAAGCGKNFEGTLAQLHHSLQRLAALPDDTLIYCAHEYAEYNLPFAQLCEPDNPAIRQRLLDTEQRAADQPAVPFTLATEKATNPFLRCTEPQLIQTLQARGLQNTDPLAVFTALTEWRSRF